MRDAQRRLAAFRRQIAESRTLDVEQPQRRPGEPVLGRHALPRSAAEAALARAAEGEAMVLSREIEARLSMRGGVLASESKRSSMSGLGDLGGSFLNVTTSTER